MTSFLKFSFNYNVLAIIKDYDAKVNHPFPKIVKFITFPSSRKMRCKAAVRFLRQNHVFLR